MAVLGQDNLLLERGKTVSGALAEGVYTKGTVVVKNNTSGLYERADIAADGDFGVLLEDVDTVNGSTAVIAKEGHFNLNKVTFNGTQTYDAVKTILNDAGIFMTAFNK